MALWWTVKQIHDEKCVNEKARDDEKTVMLSGSDVNMFSLSEQQQKDLAKSLVTFLSRHKHISDSYIIVTITF